MATVQRIFDTLDTSTFLDGGSAAYVNDTGEYSELIDLSQWEGCHCFVQANFDGTTDDLVIEVLATNDSGDHYDNIPIFSFTVDNGTDPSNVSFIITSVYGFRVLFKSSGATGAINVMFRYRRWRWETV
jgi:hypothetical protein